MQRLRIKLIPLGSPSFFYYAPLPYYFTSLLYPVFAQDPLGWRQLGISVSVALIASGLFTYLWLRMITSGRSALVASLIYMLMPYHLAVDLYTRGAFAEFWAFVWMPLTMFFTIRTVGGGQFTMVGLAVSYASLIMTHLPTT
jgi:uncharacterized membrane protein